MARLSVVAMSRRRSVALELADHERRELLGDQQSEYVCSDGCGRRVWRPALAGTPVCCHWDMLALGLRRDPILSDRHRARGL
jgi:hypothetical protein